MLTSGGGGDGIHGRIGGRTGGRKRPFVDGTAMFPLAEVGMKSCDQLPGDDSGTLVINAYKIYVKPTGG